MNRNPTPDPQAVRQRIKARLEQLVDAELSASVLPQTIDEIEEAALRLRHKAGEITAEEITREQAAQQDTNKVACSCGGVAWDKGLRARPLVSMAGLLPYLRRYYYCRRCDTGICPSDVRLGLSEDSFTTRVVQEVSRVSAALPFAPAMAMLSSLAGVSVSVKEAQRLTDTAGRIAAAYLSEQQGAAAKEDFVALRVPDVLYLLADGVQTPMRGKEASPEGAWREMKVGVARGMSRADVPLFPNRYISHLGNSEEFGQAWASLAAQAGLFRARLTVVLGDGAAWIWNQAALHFPWAVQILDYFHAAEYLWEVGRAAFGEGAAVTAWVQKREAELLGSRFSVLMQALEAVALAHPACAETVDKTRTYYTNNRARMDYKRYRQMGLWIGSGAGESGCKQVVTQRLKGAGMRWCERGAQTVARLRCLVLSQQWAEFCQSWRRLAPSIASVPA